MFVGLWHAGLRLGTMQNQGWRLLISWGHSSERAGIAHRGYAVCKQREVENGLEERNP